jgi:23S rRNA (uridine2552-2'-O)-methyltransferase
MSWRYSRISGNFLRPPNVGQTRCGRALLPFNYSSPGNILSSSGSIQARHKGSSTPAWLNRQRHDPFVKTRGKYKSRSAFKLLQMSEKYRLFPSNATIYDGDLTRNPAARAPFRVVDLGCSPGGWSQVCLELLGCSEEDYSDGRGYVEEEELLTVLEDYPRVIGVDLLPTDPIPGARFIEGDFMDPSVQNELLRILKTRPDESPDASQGSNTGKDAKVDMVISDMAPNLRGNKIADIEASLELCQMVLQFAIRHLKPAHGKDDKSGTLM